MKPGPMTLFAIGAVAVLAAALSPHTTDAAQKDSVAARLQRLEDREQILELMTAYGTTLDKRDFAAFGQLFAEDADYGSGPGSTHGRAAIAAQLEKTLTSNPSNLPGPNSHLFFNPSVEVDGDHAMAHSKGAYTVPDAKAGTTQLVFFVSYEDTFVRHDGRWYFQRRALRSSVPPAIQADKQ